MKYIITILFTLASVQLFVIYHQSGTIKELENQNLSLSIAAKQCSDSVAEMAKADSTKKEKVEVAVAQAEGSAKPIEQRARRILATPEPVRTESTCEVTDIDKLFNDYLEEIQKDEQ